MKYGSLLRDDLAFTQHEHRTDELGGSIEVYCLSIGGSSVGRGGSSRGHRDCLFFLLLVLNRVGVGGGVSVVELSFMSGAVSVNVSARCRSFNLPCLHASLRRRAA